MSHVTRTWQVENTWNCPSCSALNRGRDLDCRHCGARKDARVEDRVSGPDAPEVTDPALLRKATAGPNWTCEYCGGQDRNLQGECDHCGGLKSQPSAETSLPSARLVRDLDPPPLWKRRLIGPIVGWQLAIILASLAVLGSIVWLFIWIFTPRVVHSHVSATSWEYTVNLRERAQFHEGGEWGRPGTKGFYDDPAFNVSCDSRYYGTQDCDPYRCNPRQVSYSCNCTSYSCNCTSSCSSNRNGFSTCKQTCSTCTRCGTCYRTEYSTCYHQCPIYRDWCSYDYYDWPIKATQKTQGSDQSCRWPEMSADDNQRLQKTEKYDVQFKDEEDVFEYVPESLAAYKQFTVGEAWTLQIGKVRGKIESLQKTSTDK